jgi:hypothetical protein
MLTLVSLELSCPKVVPPAVDVKITMERPKLNISKNISEIEALADQAGGRTINPYPYINRDHIHTPGLTAMRTETKMEALTEQSYYKTASTGCLVLKKVEVDINLDQTIYITRDYKKGSCNYEAVMDHELKHANLNKRMLEKYRRPMETYIQVAVTEYLQKLGSGPFPKGQLQAMQQGIYDVTQKALTVAQDKMYRELMVGQAELDTLEEYQAVSAQCESWPAPKTKRLRSRPRGYNN